MTHYRITGRDRQSGRAIEFRIDAPTRDLALEHAEARGIVVERVRARVSVRESRRHTIRVLSTVAVALFWGGIVVVGGLLFLSSGGTAGPSGQTATDPSIEPAIVASGDPASGLPRGDFVPAAQNEFELPRHELLPEHVVETPEGMLIKRSIVVMGSHSEDRLRELLEHHMKQIKRSSRLYDPRESPAVWIYLYNSRTAYRENHPPIGSLQKKSGLNALELKFTSAAVTPEVYRSDLSLPRREAIWRRLAEADFVAGQQVDLTWPIGPGSSYERLVIEGEQEKARAYLDERSRAKFDIIREMELALAKTHTVGLGDIQLIRDEGKRRAWPKPSEAEMVGLIKEGGTASTWSPVTSTSPGRSEELIEHEDDDAMRSSSSSSSSAELD